MWISFFFFLRKVVLLLATVQGIYLLWRAKYHKMSTGSISLAPGSALQIDPSSNRAKTRSEDLIMSLLSFAKHRNTPRVPETMYQCNLVCFGPQKCIRYLRCHIKTPLWIRADVKWTSEKGGMQKDDVINCDSSSGSLTFSWRQSALVQCRSSFTMT